MVSFKKKWKALSHLNLVASKEQIAPSHCDGKEITSFCICWMLNSGLNYYERVLDHFLIRLLVCLHRSLICLLHTASFAALICPLAWSLAPVFMGKWFTPWIGRVDFIQFHPLCPDATTVACCISSHCANHHCPVLPNNHCVNCKVPLSIVVFGFDPKPWHHYHHHN